LNEVMKNRSLFLGMACWLVLCGANAVGVEMRSAMDLDPAFKPLPVVHTVPDRLVPLWLEALEGDDVEDDVVCQVARGLVRMNRLSILAPAEAVDSLAKQLRKGELDVAARLTVARALVELAAKQHAPLLMAQLSHAGRDMSEIVEPALARWGDATLRDEWLARIKDPQESARSVQLAIQGLGSIKDRTAQRLLEDLAVDVYRHSSLRISAAKALALVAESGLESFAGHMLARDHASDPLARLLAALALVGRHDEKSLELLVQLAADADPSVAAIAIETLIDVNEARRLKNSAELLANDDPNVRLLGIRALQQDPHREIIEELAKRLNDDHSMVRQAACDVLVELAESDTSREQVGQNVTKLLDARSSRAITEALLIIGSIDYEPAAEPVLELLNADDPGVAVCAAWALERLAVASTANAILVHIVRENQRTVEIVQQLAPLYAEPGEPDVALPQLGPTYEQLEHLILALGQMRHQQADAVLRRFVPKPTWPAPGEPPSLEAFKQPRPRAAAIWALGKIHADAGSQAPGQVVAMFTERLADTTPIPREEPIVRRMAAVSLARMGHRESLTTLREFFDPANANDEIGRACAWAVAQLTGQAATPAGVTTLHHVDWFLVPLDR